MSLAEFALLLVAAIAAGSINGAVGSGSLVTLPILLALGLEPQIAIATNTIAMVLSALGGVLAYRGELRSVWSSIRPLTVISTLGGLVGAIVLLTTPAGAARVVVPVLIAFALVLVLVQPRIAGWIRARSAVSAGSAESYESRGLRASIAVCSVYGGYFAAAQGVLLLGVLGAFTGAPMSRVNGVKNLLTLTVNLTAAVAFTVANLTGHVGIVWPAVAVMALGASIGGYTGGRLAKIAPAGLLRTVIVIVALASLIKEVVL